MKILSTNCLNVYASRIARGCNGENPPWRGYCWGSDWPKLSVQRSSNLICIDLVWLCYFASIYWHSNYRGMR